MAELKIEKEKIHQMARRNFERIQIETENRQQMARRNVNPIEIDVAEARVRFENACDRFDSMYELMKQNEMENDRIENT